MTICKTFTRVVPQKGKAYKKSEIVGDLAGPEKMSATYFDPSRDTLCSFFDEAGEGFENIYENNTLRFRLRNGEAIDQTAPWERTKLRHVFLRRTGQSDGKYEYLGSAIDEARISQGGHEWVQYELKRDEGRGMRDEGSNY
jgi:hypothetical protein